MSKLIATGKYVFSQTKIRTLSPWRVSHSMTCESKNRTEFSGGDTRHGFE